jgi:hypothetical protein
VITLFSEQNLFASNFPGAAYVLAILIPYA